MSSPIKDVLKALNQHSDLVEHALAGVIDAQGQASNSAIAALRQASALRPAGEEGYRLHQKLREYLQDHLQLFPAFQSLAEIGSRISQVNALWLEVDLIRRNADSETIHALVDSIQTTVFDIADNMERNMLLLQTLMSTRYGNVRSLAAKKSQNRYYQQQTNALSDDLVRLARVCDKVEREASTRSMEDLARFMRRNLLARVMDWQQGLSEMQSHLRKEIFKMREVENNLKLLARMDMMLRQQPSWQGFEIDLEEATVPDFLLVTSLSPLVAHVEPLDSERDILNEMRDLAKALPLKGEPEKPAKEPKRYTRVIDEPREIVPTPAYLAMEKLTCDLRGAPERISLVSWRLNDPDAMTMSPDIWLVFAVMGLRGKKFRVDLVSDLPRDGEKFTHSFVDAMAHPVGKKMGVTSASA